MLQHENRWVITGCLLALAAMITTAGCGGGKTAGADAGGDSGDSADASPAAVVTVSIIKAEPQSISETIDVTGTLAPMPGAESKVAPAAPGRVKEVLVRNGQHVDQGQVIATLEPGPLVGQVNQQEAAVAAAQAAVTQARAGYRSTVISSDAAVQTARTNLQSAEVALQKTLAGSRPEEITQSRSSVAAAQAAVQHAQADLDRQRRLYEAGVVALKDVQEAELQLATTRATLRSAQADLELKLRPNRPQDIAAAQLAVQEARDQLDAALGATTQNQVKAGDVAVAERQLQGAQGSLQAARAQLTAGYVRSPVSGIVVERSTEPGQYLDTSGAIATIVNMKQVRVILQVPASQVSAVHPGDQVQFTPDSQPGNTYQARVELVSTATAANTDTVAVEAVAPNPGGQLRDDGFVRGKITTATHAGALVVPAAAVVTPDGKPSVFVVDDKGVTHAHEVKTGVRQGDQVEILSGIAAGDQVVTTGAYELKDGAKVKTGGDEESSDEKSGDAKPGDEKSGDAKPGDEKSGDQKAGGDSSADSGSSAPGTASGNVNPAGDRGGSHA